MDAKPLSFGMRFEQSCSRAVDHPGECPGDGSYHRRRIGTGRIPQDSVQSSCLPTP